MTVVPDPLLWRPHVCFLASTCRVPYTRALFLASSPHVFQVCTDDSVCGSGQLCRHALPMYQRLEGVCNIFTKGFADFLGGAGTLALQMGMTDSEGGIWAGWKVQEGDEKRERQRRV